MKTQVASRGSPLVPSRRSRPIPSSALLSFLAITFAVTWGTIGVYILWPDVAAERLGEISGSHPAFFLATWGPAIAGLGVVWGHAGTGGLRAYLSRLLLWRCPPGWAAFLVLGIPLVFVAGSRIEGGPVVAPISFQGIGVAARAAILMLFLGPMEELGWRGVAQPLLQRHMAPVWAGLIIGAIWGVWHLPAFYLSGTVQSGWSFTPFFIGNVALAVIVTPLFNATRGSILLPMFFHWQLINPLWPDARPWDTWLFVLAAVVVVGLNRDAMFRRDAGWTRVVPGRPESHGVP
jgi:membrane protease YdiL (CAAX protease family)